MIKSIIKRVIVGVSIALILGAIGSCEVKAVSRDVTYTSFKYVKNDFNNETEYTPSANSFSLGNYTFARFAGVIFEGAYTYLRGNVSVDDSTPFGTYDYFSFIVISEDIEVTAVQFYNLNALICTVTPTNLLVLNTNDTRNYASVVECKTSGSNSTIYSTGMYAYLSSPGDTSFNVAFSKKIHFSNDSITTRLRAIESLLGTTNSNLDDILDELGNTNSWLSGMANRLSQLYTLVSSGNTNIVNALTSVNSSVNNVNNSINDSETSNVSTDAIDNAKNNIASNNVISNLVLLPVNLFTKILNSTSASCSPFSLGTLYGEELVLPCIVLSDYLGSSLVSVIDVLISGLFIYHISRKMIKVFEELSSLRSGGNDV